MNNIIQTIQHTARAATVLLLALLTAQAAWAQENIPEVSNAAGLAKAFSDEDVSVINVTDNITGVGDFSLDRDLTINLNGHTISGDGLYFDVGRGLSLTINGDGQDGSVGNIISGYANMNAIDNFGTVTLSHVNITTNSACAIGGPGMLYIGNNVSFNGWTSGPFDTEDVNIIEGVNYNYDTENPFANLVATVTVESTDHYFENLSVALVYINNNADKVDFSQLGDTYTIHTATGWDAFCYLLENGETFSGKTVELANDITVTRMAGLEGHEFQGTFDGNKKTLTVSISSSDGNAAPFREIMGATIRNLKVSGTVSGHKHSAGLVSYARGADSSVENTIENCLVATDVSTIVDTDGDCYLGGIVGHGFKSKLTIRGCAFTGSLTSPHNYTGGLQGWSDGNTLILENDLFAASSVNAANVGFHPIAFHVNNATTTATVSNVYYTVAPTCTTASRIAAAGKACHSMTAGENVTIDAIALTGDATEYNVSGITAYSGGGLQRGETLYYGSDDVVSLTLSNTATGAPDGYQYGYTASAGTLEGSTLTMPDQDVTVSVNTEVLTVLPWSGDGTEGSPYIIKYASQLDLLAHRVNGTHGETLREDGYSGKFFKLNNDIKYTHKADGEEGADTESNYEAIGGYYDGERYFCGHFDGNNKTISGIRIYKNGNADSYQGIFGQTYGADIHHLTLADAHITGYDYTGGIVGENNGGTVTRCHVAGDVAVCAVQSGAWNHGGIAGYTDGTIEQCTSAAALTTADANSAQFYGGIAGINYGTLRDNLAIGATVPAAGDNTYGAITGDNDGTLQCNYYTACKVADVENATGVGCNNADVTANNGARAVFALTLADGITTSTPVTVTIGTTGYYAQGTAIALSYSGDVPLGYQYAGYTASAGTISGSTLTMPAADVTVSLALTVLPWSGDGTESSPYIIYNKDQLDLLAHRVNGTHDETAVKDGYSGAYFKLANDITYPHTTDWDDAECEQESNFEAIGGDYYGVDRYFRGHFDGNNNTISGIRIYRGGKFNTDRYQGIFGRTVGADIHHLTLADARITGYDDTGGIVGYNEGGTVTRCHVAGDVAVCAVQSDAWYHGGIVGENHGGTIEQCTSAATLTTADADNSGCYGGIAGYNNSGTLRDNLAIGATVPAAKNNYYGAITGKNDGGTLQRNYYTACKVAGTENATSVGCKNADVTANNGAVSIHTLTLADGITTSTAVTVTIGTTGYYAQGTAIALSYSGDVPLGYQYEDGDGFTASAGTISGSTLTMPAADVTVSLALSSTGELVEVSYVDADGTARTDLAIALDGHEADLGIDGTETWYFVGTDIAFDHTLDLDGDVNLILADGKTMTVTSDVYNYGIYVDGSLTIYGQAEGTGALNATSENDEGIHSESGTITISGGRVTATSENADGIHSESGNITISGGRVTASGGGNGIFTYGGTITISGGRVTATSENAAGISNYGGTITLGCTTASDFIYISRYVVESEEGSLNIADGQTLFDEDGNYYSGNGVTIPAGKTLRPGLTARQAPDGNYWTTYYNSDSGFTIGAEENACAYTATYGDGQLTLHKLGKEIPAETAVIIVADNDMVSMTATDLPAYSGGTNNLRGVDDDTPTSALGTGTFYVLGMTTVGDEQHFGFHRYTGDEMAAHKAYVFVSGSQSAARSLTMVFNEASGIESLTPDAAPKAQAAQHWFTIDGRRLQAKPTAPGIYINNGRKVVIK